MTAEFTSNGFTAVASFFEKKQKQNQQHDDDDDSLLQRKTKSNRGGIEHGYKAMVRKLSESCDEIHNKNAKNKKVDGDVSSGQRMTPNNRVGVGAGHKAMIGRLIGSNDVANAQTKKKIMSIGKKRRNDEEESGDEEEVKNSNKLNAASVDSSDDDEGGRTSAIKPKVRGRDKDKQDQLYESMQKKLKKAKKKDKKKRKLQSDPDPDENTNTSSKGQDDKTVQDEILNDNNSDDIDAILNQGKSESMGAAETDKKSHDNRTKKRRKVRSKQKNVRKDNRPSSAKPEHLKIGSESYQGRPLTKETRAYLNLPESRSSSIKRQKTQLKEMSKSVAKSKDGDNNELKLGIDDLLGETLGTLANNDGFETTQENNVGIPDNDEHKDITNHDDIINDSGEAIMTDIHIDEDPVSKKSSKRKDKKKKKSKYKNLQ